MNFLTAHWKHLLLANYRVNRQCLDEFVPAGTAIDELDGQVFISLVAFLFVRTRVIGIPVPFHQRFEEVNLRFYVTPDKDRSIRAVSFIKELVPKRAIPLVANRLFHENYVALPMAHGVDHPRYWYSWGVGGRQRFSAEISRELSLPAPGSLGEFITEHYWGYARGPSSTLEYRVAHPQWKCCEVTDFEIDIDFAATYGRKFGFLSALQPASVLYAEGSAVSVSFPKRL